MRQVAVVILAALILLLPPGAAWWALQAKPSSDAPRPTQALFAFEKICSDPAAEANAKIGAHTDKADRLRICAEAYRGGPVESAAGVAFLRSRLQDLIRSTRDNADAARLVHKGVTLLAFIFAIAAAILAAFPRRLNNNSDAAAPDRLAGARAALLALAVICVGLLTSFNWHKRYAAEFAAFQSLTALRDEIDVWTADALERPIRADTATQLEKWLKSYREIMAAHGKAYSDAFGSITITTPKFGGN